LEFEEVDFETPESIQKWELLGRKSLTAALQKDFVIWLSGNHLGCKPIYDSLDARSLLLQLDAHLDCYDLHDTHATLSHGNFLRTRQGTSALINVGHRDLFLKADAIQRHFSKTISAEEWAINEEHLSHWLRERFKAVSTVWLDLDVDVFDPSICPAVPTPSPCGLSIQQFFRLMDAVPFAKLRGVSLSEFDPGRDRNDTSLNLLGWLLEWLLLKKYSA
jgi:arginase family enzyme